MKKLSKDDIAQRDEIITRLHEAKEDFLSAVEGFNKIMRQQWKGVQERIDAYNEIVGEATNWCGEIATQIQDFVNEHSDKWRDGDNGQAYEEWCSAFENAVIDTLDLDEPDELTVDFTDAAEELEAIETEVAIS